MDNSQDNDLEIEYSLTSEDLYNTILSNIAAYDFLDRSKEDIIVTKMGIKSQIEDCMMKSVESICEIVEQMYQNTVYKDAQE